MSERDNIKADLICRIYSHCKANPSDMTDLVAAATEGASRGFGDGLSEAHTRANDFEVVSSIVLDFRLFRSRMPTVLGLLKKHSPKTALNWQRHIKELEKKTEGVKS